MSDIDWKARCADLDKILIDRFRRTVKAEETLMAAALGKRPPLTLDECRDLANLIGKPENTPDEPCSVRSRVYIVMSFPSIPGRIMEAYASAADANAGANSIANEMLARYGADTLPAAASDIERDAVLEPFECDVTIVELDVSGSDDSALRAGIVDLGAKVMETQVQQAARIAALEAALAPFVELAIAVNNTMPGHDDRWALIRVRDKVVTYADLKRAQEAVGPS